MTSDYSAELDRHIRGLILHSLIKVQKLSNKPSWILLLQFTKRKCANRMSSGGCIIFIFWISKHVLVEMFSINTKRVFVWNSCWRPDHVTEYPDRSFGCEHLVAVRWTADSDFRHQLQCLDLKDVSHFVCVQECVCVCARRVAVLCGCICLPLLFAGVHLLASSSAPPPPSDSPS